MLATIEGALAAFPHARAREQLYAALAARAEMLRHGDAAAWEAALAALPPLLAQDVDPNAAAVRVGRRCDASDAERERLHAALQTLHPWRKGPFELFDVTIDSEWRSDLKWERVARHIELSGRCVLDVGCGNGYYAWRMRGAGATFVLGIDPTLRFLAQFLAVQRYMCDPCVALLPLRAEDLPARLGCFDTVLSMGVLYHRRSPFEHLGELFETLRPGGELLLETLLIEGDATRVLVPRERYAMMRNVWFIPSADALALWLERAGFTDVRLVELTPTTSAEQRRTEWMRFESLTDFLDPADPRRTREGHPAPLRGMFVARRP
ncbi:MAG TPA: tRNA 5-methoxyuridine(34)/uridine 5-oxyacetic acid(34) synthase CmoB [Pseudomonadales bacterium]|nr:tRNA 5-methoxyuridine(34)/uridine 5-oxyacetic acid(34) synthase CmoB [Pseudomonadales bacterium]